MKTNRKVHGERPASSKHVGERRLAPVRTEAPKVTGDGGGGPGPRVRVRMYRIGLGDCHLLTFQPGTADEAHVLVDIGTIGQGGGISIADAVRDIAETTGGHLRAVVASHEHADHLSGFERLRDAGITADEAWVAWTEDRSDPLARQIVKYQGDLFAATEQAAVALERARDEHRRAREALARDDPGAARESEQRFAMLDALGDGLRDLMAFNGLGARSERETLGAAAARKGGLKATIEAMMRAAIGLSPTPPRCWSPGDTFERDWAPGVRFYVLGPPRSTAAIQQLGEHGSPDLYELAFVTGARLPSAAVAPWEGEPQEAWEPFDREHMVPMADASTLGGVAAAYAEEPWRKIEEATLGAAAELGIQLDNATNNTSLVLAIEVGGEVLLFPGDAQLGSWLTWPDVRFTVPGGERERTVRGEELLRRTTFYKVGHHGSHNATARPGLERMGERGLTAFIPLDEAVARKKQWPMPARKLEERLEEKTRGRVTKSDKDAEPFPGATVTERYVEVTLPLRPAGSTARPRADAVAARR
jgi:hypothetical protein